MYKKERFIIKVGKPSFSQNYPVLVKKSSDLKNIDRQTNYRLFVLYCKVHS